MSFPRAPKTSFDDPTGQKTEKPKKMTKSQSIHWTYAVDAHRMVEHDLHNSLIQHKTLPAEWNTIWREIDRRSDKKTPVTMRLDADVVRFFKAMGAGYQPRINRVLRMYMHYRLAGILDGPDTTDYVLRPDALDTKGKPRPKFGDTKKQNARRLRANKRRAERIAEASRKAG